MDQGEAPAQGYSGQEEPLTGNNRIPQHIGVEQVESPNRSESGWKGKCLAARIHSYPPVLHSPRTADPLYRVSAVCRVLSEAARLRSGDLSRALGGFIHSRSLLSRLVCPGAARMVSGQHLMVMRWLLGRSARGSRVASCDETVVPCRREVAPRRRADGDCSLLQPGRLRKA
jgi:hypothetical protein